MTRRRFVAIDLPGSLQEILGRLNPNIRGVRWTKSDQMHLTLAFFEHVPDEIDQKFLERLATIEFGAFFLPIFGLGSFPPKGIPKIIWIGVAGGHPHLFQIYKRVQEAALAAGLEPELRPWHPHITLARCHSANPAEVKKFLKQNVELDAGKIRVKEFYLYSSELTTAGPTHTRELTVSCSGGL